MISSCLIIDDPLIDSSLLLAAKVRSDGVLDCVAFGDIGKLEALSNDRAHSKSMVGLGREFAGDSRGFGFNLVGVLGEGGSIGAVLMAPRLELDFTFDESSGCF